MPNLISQHNFLKFCSFKIYYEFLSVVFIIFFSDFFFAQLQIGAFVLLGLGIWTVADRSFMNDLLGTNLLSGTVYVLIGTSAVICVISIFGCYAAAREVKSLLLFVSSGLFIKIFVPKFRDYRKKLPYKVLLEKCSVRNSFRKMRS